MTKTSVIIPFYQKQAGILLKAIESINNQTALERVQEVIIVDDGSPISAESELGNFNGALASRIKIHRIENGGVSKARNYGLDCVSSESEYVSFLDSDDSWLDNHILQSLQALDCGSDFHFCNFTQLKQDVGAFERAGRIDVNHHLAINETENYFYQGDMLSQITFANLIGTPTVTYRFKTYPKLRFDETYHFAGEDYHMWLKLCSSVNKISFTSSVTCHCGEGVNIFSGAQWGSKHLGLRLLDEVKYREQILANYSLSQDDKEKLTQIIAAKKQDFKNNLLSMLKNLKIVSALTLLYKK